MIREGIHRTHCCILHGCKYGDKDCPVADGTIKQDYVCEHCDVYDNIHTMEELNERIEIDNLKTAEKFEAIRIGLDGVNEALELNEYVHGDAKHKRLRRMKLYLKNLSREISRP